MSFPRASGVLLHPTSLPGRYGIGDLGPAAFEFIDLLASGRQRIWQVLPLGPTGYGDSPYQCFSSFAGNPLLIHVPELGDGFRQDQVDFPRVIPAKRAQLRAATAAFHPDDGYREFVARQGGW